MRTHLTATGRHLPYGITQCYLLPDTSERALRLNPSQTGRYSIYLPQRDGRLSWHSLIAIRSEIEPTTAWSQVQRPNRYATKPPSFSSNVAILNNTTDRSFELYCYEESYRKPQTTELWWNSLKYCKAAFGDMASHHLRDASRWSSSFNHWYF